MGFKIVYSIWCFTTQRTRFHIGTCVWVFVPVQALSCSVNFWTIGALVVFLIACRSPICKKSSVRSHFVINTDSHTGYKQLYMARCTCYTGIYVPSGGQHSECCMIIWKRGLALMQNEYTSILGQHASWRTSAINMFLTTVLHGN